MNQGRIEQIGTPRDLYATPATPFVASFVGEMNTVALEPLGNSSFRVSGQIVTLPNLTAGRYGVRPEAIALEPNTEQSQGLRGTVELVTYLGADQQVILRVGQDTWIARVPNDLVFTRGQTVGLEIASNAWLRLE